MLSLCSKLYQIMSYPTILHETEAESAVYDAKPNFDNDRVTGVLYYAMFCP